MRWSIQAVPLYLKDMKKITAYVHGDYLALLLWRSMPAVMRQNQARPGFTLPYPHEAFQPTPTIKRLKEIFTLSQSFSGMRLREKFTVIGVPSVASNTMPYYYSA